MPDNQLLTLIPNIHYVSLIPCKPVSRGSVVPTDLIWSLVAGGSA